MNVKELRETLLRLPDDAEVLVAFDEDSQVGIPGASYELTGEAADDRHAFAEDGDVDDCCALCDVHRNFHGSSPVRVYLRGSL